MDDLMSPAASCSHPNVRPCGPDGWRDNAGRQWLVCPGCNEQWPLVAARPVTSSPAGHVHYEDDPDACTEFCDPATDQQPCTCPESGGPWEPDWDGITQIDPDCYWHGNRDRSQSGAT